MKEQLLDDNFSEEGINEIQPTLINWISIIILWVGIALSIKNGILYDSDILLAFCLLTIATIVSYIKFNIGVKITLGIILIGIFKLIQFFPYTIIIHLGLPFELIMTAIGFIHFFTNRNILGGMLSADITEEKLKTKERERIDRFKKRFSKNTSKELEAMLDNESLLAEAKQASKELLEERKDSE